jgi:hypothetical protein
MKQFHAYHQCAPKAWRKTANVTGDYDFDASIQHANADGKRKLQEHVATSSYGYRTGYNGYSGLAGDD